VIVELAIAAGALTIGGATVALRRYQQRRRAASQSLDVASATQDPRDSALNTGDVVLYGPDELWLASALRLREEEFALSLFHCPGSRIADYLLCLGGEANEVAFMKEVGDFPPGPVAAEVSWEGRQHDLERRGTALIENEGESSLVNSSHAAFTLLRSPTGHVILVLDPREERRLALYGEAVERCLIEVLPRDDR
jgi:hypothetical protein